MVITRKTSLLIVPVLAALCLLSPHRYNALSAQTPSIEARPASAPQQRAASIVYDVTPDFAAMPPVLRVAITLNVPAPESKLAQDSKSQAIALQMPVWCPGDYHVQNFGKYVQDFRARNMLAVGESQNLAVTHTDASTWTIHTGGAKLIRVEYALAQMPPGYFSENVFLRPRYAFVNGASALMYLVGHKADPARLVAHLPEGWKAETPLAENKEVTAMLDSTASARPNNQRVFDAPDYDTLADSPLVIAAEDALQTFDLKLDQLPKTVYRPVYFGNERPSPANMDALNKMLLRIAGAETTIMGGASGPLYEFLLEVNGRGGGLEHLNSCRLPLRPNASSQGFAPFVAHEFFHQWNIKRIRPRVLGPFDYAQPPRTHNLWFAEGVTDYYAYIAVRRAGLLSEDRFLAHWQRAIANMQRNPARLQVTADEASWKVWEGGDSEGFGGLSYYAKGALIGLCLDLKVRNVTHNQRSLDDVMRAMYKQCMPPNPGYGEDDIRDTVNKIAGQDLTEFYNRLARSTQEMPFAECLDYAGLDAELQPLPQATPDQITLRKKWTAEMEGL